jgi:two-component system NtrC family sensor kinase
VTTAPPDSTDSDESDPVPLRNRGPDKTLTRPGLAAGVLLSRYRRLRQFSVTVTLLVAIIPLLIMMVINYLHDQDAYRTETQTAVSRILSTTKRSLEFAIEERRNALSLVLSENTYAELLRDTALAFTLHNLQDAFGGFVDLGVIGSTGNQENYVGPYDLEERNYQDQDWFHEVLLRGAYVSDVFMGYRNFPHFVIAFRDQKEDGDTYILRATLDMELIHSRLDDLELDRQTDAFLINQEGILQTASSFYGDVLGHADIEFLQSRTSETARAYHQNGEWVVLADAPITGSSFRLVVIRRISSPFRAWLAGNYVILWFLAGSTALIVAVVLWGSSRMVAQLREADARRAKAIHDLEYANKLATIGRMAASVAHEINNPLAIIDENAGLIEDMATFADDYPDREKTQRLVNSIHKSVERCSNVTHRLLGFAKRMDLRREPIALNHLLEEVVGFQRTETTHRNIDVEYQFPNDSVPIESDRGKLQQVFLNLLSNALAAVDDGGRIEIGLDYLDGSKVAVFIRDNGIGISPEDLQHIFEPFYSTKGEFGTGLGLSITRDIVAKLGGSIEVQSKPGQGSSFTVTLPIKFSDHPGVEE